MNVTQLFNSKETYLAARADWKANYARLTVEAREARKAFNDAAAAFSKIGSYRWNLGYSSPENAAYNAAYKVMNDARTNRAVIRREANDALNDLVEMKKEAASQWMAKHLAIA